jgi:intein/homing endonuclease
VAKSLSERLNAAAPLRADGEVKETISDIQRILGLPKRPPVDCERDPITKLYKPTTQALIEVMTEKFSRGPRLSCACRERRVSKLADGTLAITRTRPDGEPPEAPLVVTVEAFEKDILWHIATEVAAVQTVKAMKPGDMITLPSADTRGHACIEILNAVQSWLLREATQCEGVVGFCGVGSGKCLHGDTEIFDINTARRRFVKESGSLKVPSFDGKNLGAHSATAFPSGSKSCTKLRLADGSEIILSLDHRVYTQRGWVEAQQLTLNDFVAVATHIPEPSSPTRATDDEISMIAFLLADGACNHDSVGFANETPAIISEFQRIASIVGNGFTEDKQKSKARDFNLIGTHDRRNHQGGPDGTGFRNKWDLYGLSKEKRVKAEIWGLPRNQVALFLNRFWACDGHISKLELECTLASEKLIDDLRFLLLRIGVRSRKKYKKAKCKEKFFDAWRISISGENALTFLNTVGDVLGKEDACRRLRDKLNATKRNTNFDVVPIGRPELYEICDELGFPRRPTEYDGAQSRTKLVREYFKATAGQLVSRKRFVEFCRQHNYQGKYAHLGVEDLGWERVESFTDMGSQQVFDLTVPETQNFVANGMVVHNSIAFLLAALIYPDSKLAVLLFEPKQRQHYRSQYLRLREHFRVGSIVFDDGQPGYTVPGTTPLHLISYSVLSQTRNSDMLDKRSPDTLMLDEAHRACGDSAINRRVKRYIADKIKQREEKIQQGKPVFSRAVRLLDASGTLESEGVEDTHMLCTFSLGTGSPIPLDPVEAEKWAKVIDPSYQPDRKSLTAKMLQRTFGGGEVDDSDMNNLFGPGPEVAIRRGFRQRRLWTPGIISASASTINAAIYLSERKPPKMPQSVKDALLKVRTEQLRPDGELLTEKMEQVGCARNVACGYYNYWAFPAHPCLCEELERRCDECALIDDWFAKRKVFNKELRTKLQAGEQYLDSKTLCEEAAKRYFQEPAYQGELPTWACMSWPAWAEIENRVQHEEREKWIENGGDWLVQDAAKWALDEKKGVVWIQGDAFGQALSKLTGLPLYNGGPGAEARLRSEKGNRSIICSIKAHGAGTDGLQEIFQHQLIVETPASNSKQSGYEQLLGRLHREGQKAPEVFTEGYFHVRELKDALRKAVEQAEFNYEMTGNKQKLFMADISVEGL